MASFQDTLALIFNKGNGTQISSIVLDASISEQHHASAEVTDHPVEKGVNISDHIRKKPDVVVINGIVSNRTLRFPEGIVGIAPIQSLERAVNGVSNDIAATTHSKFLELIQGKELIKIVTSLRTYENMLIEEYSVDRDVRKGDAIVFTLRAKQITLVTTELISIPTLPGAKKKLDTKPTQEAPTPVQNKSSSLISIGKVAGVIH